jgi:hypothetical protein
VVQAQKRQLSNACQEVQFSAKLCYPVQNKGRAKCENSQAVGFLKNSAAHGGIEK